MRTSSGARPVADERRRTRLRWCLQRLHLRRGMGRRDGDETRARIGVFWDDPPGVHPHPHNLSHVTLGVLLFLAALPLLVLGCGDIVPGTGYFDISMASGDLARFPKRPRVDNRWRRCWSSDRISTEGAAALFGPIAGYVAGTSIFATVAPWKMLLISMGGPIVCFATSRVVNRLRIDEGKVIPIALGPASTVRSSAGSSRGISRPAAIWGLPVSTASSTQASPRGSRCWVWWSQLASLSSRHTSS